MTAIFYSTSTDLIITNTYLLNDMLIDDKSYARCVTYKNNLYVFEVKTEGGTDTLYLRILFPDYSSETVKTNITGLESNVSGCVHNDSLYITFISKNTDPNLNRTNIAKYDDIKKEFKIADKAEYPASEDPSIISYKGKLYLFFHGFDDDYVWFGSSTDTINWSAATQITETVHNREIKSKLSPRVIVYQGMLYIFFKDLDDKFFYVNYNGNNFGNAYSMPQTDSSHSPGLVVFNGVLRVGFIVNSSSNIFIHSFDGISWSDSPARITGLSAKNGVDLGVIGSNIYLFYPGVDS